MRVHYFLIGFAFSFFLFSPLKSDNGVHQAIPENFIRLPRLVIPVIQNSYARDNFTILLVVEANGMEKADELRKFTPRLTNLAYSDIYGLFAVVWEPGYHINLKELKDRLVRRYNEVFGKDMVKDVLVEIIND